MTTNFTRSANDNGVASNDFPELLRPFIDLLARQAVREQGAAANDNGAVSGCTNTAR